MSHLVLTLYAAVLFVLLSPGTLVKLPPKGGKWVVVAVHVLLFGLVLYLTGDFVAHAVGKAMAPQYHAAHPHHAPTQPHHAAQHHAATHAPQHHAPVGLISG